jgi:hypothetical protein
MISDITPANTGAEVPIAGAHVREGQGAGADRQTARENARMTMCRFSFARLQINEKIHCHFFVPAHSTGVWRRARVAILAKHVL